MHKIYTWIPHAKLLIFILISTYLFISLFICLFLSWYYCFYLVILWPGVIILYQVIFFVNGYTRSPKFKSLLPTKWRGHRQNKSRCRTYCVTMYQRKIQTKLFPNQDVVQWSYFLALTSRTLWREAIECMWLICSHNNAILALREWQKCL